MIHAGNQSKSQREDTRARFLHDLCEQIELWRALGDTIAQAIGRAHKVRRKALFPNGRLSRGALVRIYYIWRKNRAPAALHRNYKAGTFLPRIPLALVEEFLNRLTADGVVPAKAVMQSLRADWKLGRSIPGLGNWREYWHRLHGSAAQRAVPPAFPVSVTTLYGYLASGSPAAYQKRITAALQAQRELNRFLTYIEHRRAAITDSRRHELLGESTPKSTPQPKAYT